MDDHSIDPELEAALAPVGWESTATPAPQPTRVWVVTFDDPETPMTPAEATLGVFASEQAAVAFAEGPEAEPSVEQAGGFSDPHGGFEVEADGTWHASLGNGGDLVITPIQVRVA